MTQENHNQTNSSQDHALYVCLGKSWSSKERAAIRDCRLAIETGKIPLLLCLPNSFIEARARKHGINVIYAQSSSFARFWQFVFLKRLISHYNVQYVHCYDINYLLLICFSLILSPSIPLFFSQFQLVTKAYRTILTDILFKRIDVCVVPFVEMEDSLVNQLGISARKIVVCGTGLDEPDVTGVERQRFSVGINIKPHIKKFEEIATLTNAAFVFQSRGFTDFIIYLHFEGDIENLSLVQELKNQIMAWHLENNFVFLHGLSLPQLASQVELWLELENSGKLEDGMLMALMCGIPILVPRNGVTQELFESFPGVGESYHTGDVRELKQKIQHIFNNLGAYQARARASHPGLLEAQGLTRYRAVVGRSYEQGLRRRKRRS